MNLEPETDGAREGTDRELVANNGSKGLSRPQRVHDKMFFKREGENREGFYVNK